MACAMACHNTCNGTRDGTRVAFVCWHHGFPANHLSQGMGNFDTRRTSYSIPGPSLFAAVATEAETASWAFLVYFQAGPLQACSQARLRARSRVFKKGDRGLCFFEQLWQPKYRYDDARG